MNNEIQIGNYYINESQETIRIDYKRPFTFYLNLVVSLSLAFLPLTLLVVVLFISIGTVSLSELVTLTLNTVLLQFAIVLVIMLFYFSMRYSIKKLRSPTKEIVVIDLLERTIQIKNSNNKRSKLNFDAIEHFWLIGHTNENILEEGERYVETKCELNIQLKKSNEIIVYEFDFNNLLTPSDENNTIKVCQRLVKYISNKCEKNYTWKYQKKSNYGMDNLT